MRETEFATDETKENEGTWVEFGAGLRVKVASTENREYTRFMLENGAGSLLSRTGRLRSIDLDKIENTLCIGISKHILFGWEGLEDAEGEEVKYSPARALEYLKKYRKFRVGILELAQDEALFKAEQMEGEAKNSSNVSDGS